MKSIFELDDFGILPLPGETAERFEKRGNHILDISRQDDDSALIRHFGEQSREFYVFYPFDKNYSARRRALDYLKKKYGTDMSWVKMLRARLFDSRLISHFSLAYGGCTAMVSPDGYFYPVIAIVRNCDNTVRHELLHAERIVFWAYSPHDESFEERVADNGYFGNFLKEALGVRSGEFRGIRRMLEENFGDKHGYVFLRLTSGEIRGLPKIYPDGDLKKYLREKSKEKLVYWIMAKKLGLIR